MQGFKGTVNSKRSIFGLVVLALAYILVFTEHLTGSDWVDFAKWITITIIFAHTASSISDKRSPRSPAPVAAAPEKTS